MPTETADQLNTRIVTQLNALRCPECQSPLIFGGWESIYRYVDLADTASGWQEGKYRGDGMTLECASDNTHNVSDVAPDNDAEIQDFLRPLWERPLEISSANT